MHSISATPTSSGTVPTLLAHLRDQLRAHGISRDDVDAQYGLACDCMGRFAASSLLMREVLWQGVRQNIIANGLMERWQELCADSTSVFKTPDSQANKTQAAETICRGESAANPSSYQTPPVLRPHEEEILRHATREGRGAVRQGRCLLAARQCCMDHQLSFEHFLQALRDRYGLHRATAYTYIKCAEWDLPENLGFGIMKWIVQGGDADLAAEIVRDLLANGRSLSELKKIYGARRALLKRRVITNDAEAGCQGSSNAHTHLLKEKERLAAERTRIELRIKEIEQRITKLYANNIQQSS